MSPLTAILTSQPAYIVVSVRAGKDFRVAVPRAPLTKFIIASEAPDFVVVRPEAAVVSNTAAIGHCRFGGDPIPDSFIYGRTMGEPLASLRAILKRYNYMGFWAASADGSAASTNHYFSTSNPLHEMVMLTASDNYGSNLSNPVVLSANNTMFRWFKAGFIGHRGGVRIRVRSPINTVAGLDLGRPMFTVELDPTQVPHSIAVGNLPSSRGEGNAVEFITEVKSEYCDVRIPDYSTSRFTPGGTNVVNASSGFGWWSLWCTRPSQGNASVFYYFYRAVDEDFSFIGYTGAPVLTF